MIDTNNPVQKEWLERINHEIGNLITSNLAFETQVRLLSQKVMELMEENEKKTAQMADMGATNYSYRQEIERLKSQDLAKRRKPNGTNTDQG